MRPCLFCPFRLWQVLATAGFVLLFYLASASGCTSTAVIVNQTPESAQVSLMLENIVVWRGTVPAGSTVSARYRIATDSGLLLKAEFAHGSVSGKGKGYVMILQPLSEIFILEADRVSTAVLERGQNQVEALLMAARSAGACAVQSVLDLTGAPDPATLK
jgi:hypothetical protein